MPANKCVFKRIEKKYKLPNTAKEQLLKQISNRLIADANGENTICSLYLDTPDYLLIRNSMDAKLYKEKIRLRSYGFPTDDSMVFLELKRKFDGVGYKRRQSMTLKEAENYIYNGILPCNSQIMSEIDYFMRFYNNPKPAIRIAYERKAFYAKDFPSLRLTFDTNIRYTADSLDMRKSFDGTHILPEDESLLEIKCEGAMPLWLVKSLSELNIMPSSFSKYATAYKSLFLQHNLVNNQGGNNNVVNF